MYTLLPRDLRRYIDARKQPPKPAPVPAAA
jgi:hypothetical protein